jgi:hypothetical protein
MLNLKRLCISVKKEVRVRFVYVGMAGDHEESHVDLHASRFHLDEDEEVPFSQPIAKVTMKENLP